MKLLLAPSRLSFLLSRSVLQLKSCCLKELIHGILGDFVLVQNYLEIGGNLKIVVY